MPNATNPHRAVIFDMDGLMLDTERIERTACQQAAAAMGHRIEDDFYLRVVGRTGADTRLIFTEYYGEAFPYEDFHKHLRQRRDDIIASEGVQLKPGLLELLNHLEQRPLPLAVATSTVRSRAERLLTLTGLMPRFHAVVCGDEVPRTKPAPDVFLKAAALLGVQPGECLVLEDSEPGVMAAHAAGMKVIVVPDLKHPAREIVALAAAVCGSLQEVLGLV